MGSVEDSTDRTKKPKMNTFSAALLLTAGLVSSAPGGGYYKGYGRSQPSKNVFNTLASDPQFSTLVAAVTAAGLTEKAISDLGPLTWVNENIHHFGGDKDQVTIFGESAGSLSCSVLMVSPLTQGLFHRVIMDSGVFNAASYQAQN